jgi:hypothetical protein
VDCLSYYETDNSVPFSIEGVLLSYLESSKRYVSTTTVVLSVYDVVVDCIII